MIDDKLRVGVTYDPAKGYISSHPELRGSFTALSLKWIAPQDRSCVDTR